MSSIERERALMEHYLALTSLWRGHADMVRPPFCQSYIDMAEYYHALARRHHANMVGFASREGSDAETG